ncbi:hypothetical protein ZIOFF_032129 [Zingiber officinale]|uniref:Uncharacterized protein n=1 Tax=Zingiber officinale TaxID=94328 RepID=A0A8J5GUY6_ZINOF|nr:hypothetical protein ZIOFF_032129 [Zingiber officinale]
MLNANLVDSFSQTGRAHGRMDASSSQRKRRGGDNDRLPSKPRHACLSLPRGEKGPAASEEDVEEFFAILRRMRDASQFVSVGRGTAATARNQMAGKVTLIASLFYKKRDHNPVSSLTSNSLQLDSSDSCFPGSSEAETSSAAEAAAVLAVARGMRSDRLFFEPGRTRSLVDEEAVETEKLQFKGNIAVELDSDDPFSDFRLSMEEVVLANGETKLKRPQGIDLNADPCRCCSLIGDLLQVPAHADHDLPHGAGQRLGVLSVHGIAVRGVADRGVTEGSRGDRMSDGECS